jgi:hypothetical protein
MGFFKKVKDRIEKESSGEGNDYENFYSKSLCDRVFSLPLTMDDRYKNVALSGRIYELPTQFQKNAANHLFDGHSSPDADEITAGMNNHPLADHVALTRIFELTIGLLLSASWDRASQTNRKDLTEYSLTLEPILFSFTSHISSRAYEDNRWNRAPWFTFYRQRAFFHESPGSIKMRKDQVNIDAKFDTKIGFREMIQGVPLGEIGFSDNYIFGSPEYAFL